MLPPAFAGGFSIAGVAHRFSGLRPRLLMLDLLPTIFAGLLAATGAFWAVKNDHEAQMQQALTRAIGLAERDLQDAAQRMAGYTASFAQRPDLIAALAAGDAAKLRDILVPGLAAMRAVDPTVSALEVTNTSGRVIMRGHDPNRVGDDKSHLPDVASAHKGNGMLGSEVSPSSGRFATGAAMDKVLTIIGFAALAVLGITIPVALFAARRIAKPLSDMAGAMGRLAKGDTALEIPGRGRSDEVGSMAEAPEKLREQAEANAAFEATAAIERAARDRRQAMVESLTQEFGGSVASIMDRLRDSAGGMREASVSMASATEQTRNRVADTADGAQQKSSNLAAVAAATEEMTASVTEISRHVAEAARAAQDALERANSTGATVRGLVEEEAHLVEIARDGDSLKATGTFTLGMVVELALAGAGAAIPARVVLIEGGRIGLAFAQNAEDVAAVDRLISGVQAAIKTAARGVKLAA